jgi:osmotically-inducible protein OsmY
MTAAALHRPCSARGVREPSRRLRAVTSKPVESPDTALRRAVLVRLIADPFVSTGHIAVTAIAGRVTLTGYVTSNAQKEAARATTRRVKGVEQVADEVRVAVPCITLADLASEHVEATPPTAAPRPLAASAKLYATRHG